MQSLPSRERGLKSELRMPDEEKSRVAPLAGAWIEINLPDFGLFFAASSLPSRERGLKFIHRHVVQPRAESLPSRERGLK